MNYLNDTKWYKQDQQHCLLCVCCISLQGQLISVRLQQMHVENSVDCLQCIFFVCLFTKYWAQFTCHLSWLPDELELMVLDILWTQHMLFFHVSYITQCRWNSSEKSALKKRKLKNSDIGRHYPKQLLRMPKSPGSGQSFYLGVFYINHISLASHKT